MKPRLSRATSDPFETVKQVMKSNRYVVHMCYFKSNQYSFRQYNKPMPEYQIYNNFDTVTSPAYLTAHNWQK